MTPEDNRDYWFPAKRYGLGWGFPVRWQGWLVIVAFVVLVFGGIWVLRPDRHPAVFIVYMVVLATLLVVTCWLKGEKTRWHRGDE